MAKGAHILVGCNVHFFGSAMMTVVPAPSAECERKVPACNSIIFGAKGTPSIRSGRATKKARHVSAAGFLFITYRNVINSDNGLA
jgi:hypothetical protein